MLYTISQLTQAASTRCGRVYAQSSTTAARCAEQKTVLDVLHECHSIPCSRFTVLPGFHTVCQQGLQACRLSRRSLLAFACRALSCAIELLAQFHLHGPAGATALRTTWLLRETLCVKDEILKKLEGQQNITFNLDAWTDNAGHSVYACNIVFSDRQIAQWACEDKSSESHTAEYLAGDAHETNQFWARVTVILLCDSLAIQLYCGILRADLIMKWITEIGRERVGGLVTDNAANIKKARELTVAAEGFTHILEMR